MWKNHRDGNDMESYQISIKPKGPMSKGNYVDLFSRPECLLRKRLQEASVLKFSLDGCNTADVSWPLKLSTSKRAVFNFNGRVMAMERARQLKRAQNVPFSGWKSSLQIHFWNPPKRVPSPQKDSFLDIPSLHLQGKDLTGLLLLAGTHC